MTARAALAVLIAAVVGVIVWLLLDGRGPGDSPGFVADPGDERAGAAGSEPEPRVPSSQPAIRPRAFVEDDEAESLPEGGLLVTVVNAEDRPVAKAIVAVLDPSAPPVPPHELLPALTRDDGSARVRLDIPMQQAHLVVLARGHAPAIARVDDPLRQKVTLSGEPLVRGKVLVDGAPPQSPISLSLHGYSDLSHGWGNSVWAFMDRHGFVSRSGGPAQIPFDTDRNGAFEVRGLIRGEGCMIAIPDGYVLATHIPERSGRGPIRAMADGSPLVVELATMNALTARVVTAKRASPTPGPAEVGVRYTLKVPGRFDEPWGSVQTRVGHPFKIHFSEGTLAGVSLEVWEGANPGRRLAQKTIDEKITGSKDLGDIVLEDPTIVTFVVKDPAARPIPDARVLAFGHLSPKSGSDGRTALGIYPTVRAVVIGAPRFRIVGFTLPEKLPETMEIRLDPAWTIVVRVRHEDPGESLRGLRVAIAYEVDAAGAAAESSTEFGDVRIGRPVLSDRVTSPRAVTAGVHGERPGYQTHWYDVRPGEDIVVSGFKKEDDVRVRVEDRTGGELLDEGATFEDDDVKAMEMIVRSRPRAVRGIILDDRGQPVAGATVWIGRHKTESDSLGKFQLDDVYVAEPHLNVRAPGHVWKSIQGRQVFDSPNIVLDRGRRLLVQLMGPSSGPFEGSAVLQIAGGETFEAQKNAPDILVFGAVPCRPATLRVSGRTSQVSLAIGAEETRVEVARPE